MNTYRCSLFFFLYNSLSRRMPDFDLTNDELKERDETRNGDVS